MADDYTRDLCCICHDSKTDIHEACERCKIKICEHCFYSQCKMLCPICDREELNKPKECGVCQKFFHDKDTSVCCICNEQICNACFDTRHDCNDYMRVFTDDQDKVPNILRCWTNDLVKEQTNCAFAHIGDIHVAGFEEDCLVKVIKDGDILYFIWDTDVQKTLHKNKKNIGMVIYELNILHRGVKTFDVSNAHHYDKIKRFVRMLNPTLF